MGWQAATRTESISVWLRGGRGDRGRPGESSLSRLLLVFHIDPYRHYCFKEHVWSCFQSFQSGLKPFHAVPPQTFCCFFASLHILLHFYCWTHVFAKMMIFFFLLLFILKYAFIVFEIGFKLCVSKGVNKCHFHYPRLYLNIYSLFLPFVFITAVIVAWQLNWLMCTWGCYGLYAAAAHSLAHSRSSLLSPFAGTEHQTNKQKINCLLTYGTVTFFSSKFHTLAWGLCVVFVFLFFFCSP